VIAPRSATVVITTKDRKDDLRRCLQSAVAQSEPAEILVIDDGSSDGTPAMLAGEFPRIRVVTHPTPLGYIRRRNEGAQLAAGRVIFSLDDDAAFSSPKTIAQTLDEFDAEAIGAVAIPVVDVNRGTNINQRTPDPGAVHLNGSFIGTAHAVRRDVFLQLGGYREALFHQGEERDFCIRMLAAGFVVRRGAADPIHHFESPRRDFWRMDHYGPRNAVLYAWQNVPLPYLLIHLPATVIGVLLWTLRPARLAARMAGVLDGLRQCFHHERQPVPARTYRLMRRLETEIPPPRLQDVAAELRMPMP
jgi:GT2 family glycosyltransferase